MVNHWKNRTGPATTILVVLASAILACSSQDQAPGKSSETESRLRWGTFLPPALPFDPHNTFVNGTLSHLSLMFDSLLGEDLKGNLVPALATEWTVGDKVIVARDPTGCTQWKSNILSREI